MAAKAKGRFIDPMLLLKTDSLPNDGGRWEYQLKFDGYRAIAFKTGGRIHLRSRNDNDFSIRYSGVVKGLAKLPDETVIDGEVIALDDDGRPSFHLLQNYGSSTAPVLYFVFDVMVLAGRDVMREPREMRRELLEKKILPKLGEPVRYAAPLDASLPVLIESVKAHRLEGLVAKRVDRRYEAGLRSGAWQKMRVNRGQEFVIGGYTVGSRTFDALVLGYYEGDRLIYAARTRNGFTPVVREQLFKKPGEHLAPPVAQILDSRVYELRWRLGFLRPALLHVTCLDSSLVAQRADLHRRDVQKRREDDLRQGSLAEGPFKPLQFQSRRQRQARHRLPRRRQGGRKGSEGSHSGRHGLEQVFSPRLVRKVDPLETDPRLYALVRQVIPSTRMPGNVYVGRVRQAQPPR